jgi:hypothetical protein
MNSSQAFCAVGKFYLMSMVRYSMVGNAETRDITYYNDYGD